MAVTKADARDGALLDGRRTQKRIRQLLGEGFTKTQLARRLGYRTHALQIKFERVTVRNAWRVEKLYRELTT